MATEIVQKCCAGSAATAKTGAAPPVAEPPPMHYRALCPTRRARSRIQAIDLLVCVHMSVVKPVRQAGRRVPNLVGELIEVYPLAVVAAQCDGLRQDLLSTHCAWRGPELPHP
jgi:hypothetical protein